jgi:hypothetical protein
MDRDNDFCQVANQIRPIDAVSAFPIYFRGNLNEFLLSGVIPNVGNLQQYFFFCTYFD